MKNDWKLEILNIELTTRCPLRCPQCYCSLDTGVDIELNLAKKRIDEACSMGVKSLNLSGGETLCYPYLFDLISYASYKRISSILVAISGMYFDEEKLDKMIEAGVTGICVSINGSTEHINAFSRDGYNHAINALKILAKKKYPNTIINWVMHSTNADDFVNLVDLAEHYNVALIDIISLKPDSNSSMRTFPSKEQIVSVSKFIKKYAGPVKIQIESCYSNFLAYHLETKLFGNLNITAHKGCTAGRNSISVDVHGCFTPCRHIVAIEDFDSMEDYWNNSELILRLREIEGNSVEPCKSCYYSPYCRHCQAISWNQKGDVYVGFEGCPVYKPITTVNT